MQAQTALAAALTNAGVRTATHRKVRLGSGPLMISFLVKKGDEFDANIEPFNPERNTKNTGRKVFNLQGNIKLGESVLNGYAPASMKAFSGCGSKGDRVRIIFTMKKSGKPSACEGIDELVLAAMFAKFATKGYDFFELYNNGENGYLLQLRGENTNNAARFIEI
jgi:hypothetical protein